MKANLEKRLQSLEADYGHNCPRCLRLAAMTEEELDKELNRILKILGYAKQHEIGQDGTTDPEKMT
jgi:hypothetical protein